jgi:uncharacterized radical SAM superfamily Fe-S cluster-containing enzyme
MSDIYFSSTRSLCPLCRELIDAKVIFRDGRVYFRKFCPEHGFSEALICNDSDWYLRSLSIIKPGTIPLYFSTEVEKGCPEDCGLCPDHQQHTCLPIVEITDACNLECPICLVHNRNRYFMTLEEYQAIIDRLILCEGTLDLINLSGGEPTIHPQFFQMIDMSIRPEILRVTVSSNGLRIAQDERFAAELAERDVVLSLQLDGFRPETHIALRGSDLTEIKAKALGRLMEYQISTSITVTLAKGVNEGEVGEILQYALENEHVLSIMFQPTAYTGLRGRHFPRPDGERITIPDVISLIADQSEGLLEMSDFTSLPCSHPVCFALTYLLKLDDSSFVPIPRLVDVEQYLDIIKNRAIMGLEKESFEAIKDSVYRLWSSAGLVPDSEKVLKTIRDVLREISGIRTFSPKEVLRLGEKRVKSILIHAFMDEDTFDISRAMKCCDQYPLPDGRLMPCCVYNTIYRSERRE